MPTQDAFTFDPERVSGFGPADTRPPETPGWLEGLQATFRSNRDDIPGTFENLNRTTYRDLGLSILDNPAASRTFRRQWMLDPIMDVPGADNEERYSRIWSEIEAIRSRNPKAFPDVPNTRAEFDKRWIGEFKTRHAKDEETASRTPTLPWLAGGIGAGFTDPINALSMGIGGTAKTVAGSILREAAINTATELVEQPMINQERKAQGREALTAQERLVGLGVAAVVGAGVPAVGHVAGKAIDKIGEKLIPEDVRLAKALKDSVRGEWELTPEQAAAINVVERDAQIEQASPYVGTYTASTVHNDRLRDATARIDNPAGFVPQPKKPSGVGAFISAVSKQESGNNPNARSQTSSASGLYGFTNGTWLKTYRREFPNSGLSDAAILGRKGDASLQTRLMQRLTQDNAYFLRQHGLSDDPGNLYVVHHLGQGGAARVFSAKPDRLLSDIMPAEVMAANPHMKGMTAGDFIAWSREKMGVAGDAPIERIAGEETDAADALIASLDEEARSLDIERSRMDEQGREPEARYEGEDIALPQLRRDLFPDDTSWRIAQAASDAEALGSEPVVTRQSVWEDARDRLIADQAGVIEGALFHKDVGPIDVLWGGDKGGLAKIVQKHQEVLDRLPELLDQMGVKSQSKNRVVLQSLDHRAVVRLDFDGQTQHWLLSAYQVKGKAPSSADYRGANEVAQDRSPARGADADIAPESVTINLPSDLAGKARPWGTDGEGNASGNYRFETKRGPMLWNPSTGEAVLGTERFPASADEVRALLEPETTPPPEAVMARFDEPDGDGIAEVAESLWHDIRADLGDDGMANYRVDLDDGKGVISAAEAEEDIKKTLAGIEAVRKCL